MTSESVLHLGKVVQHGSLNLSEDIGCHRTFWGEIPWNCPSNHPPKQRDYWQKQRTIDQHRGSHTAVLPANQDAFDRKHTLNKMTHQARMSFDLVLSILHRSYPCERFHWNTKYLSLLLTKPEDTRGENKNVKPSSFTRQWRCQASSQKKGSPDPDDQILPPGLMTHGGRR